MIVVHYKWGDIMAKCSNILIMSLALTCVVSSVDGVLLPTANANMTNQTTNANNIALSQLINSRTQQANKVFENINYQKMSGTDKDSFFDDGGLGNISSDSRIKNFHMKSDTDDGVE